MDKHFVYFNDDYENVGGVGLKEFETIEDACRFIEDRILAKPSRTIDEYILISGRRIEIETYETITKIRAVIKECQ